MALIGNGSRLEDPCRLLVHQDKLQLLPGETAKGFGIEIGRTVLVDSLMLMVEVIVVPPSKEGFIDLRDPFDFGPVSLYRPSCALKLFASFPDLDLASDQLENSVFFTRNGGNGAWGPPLGPS